MATGLELSTVTIILKLGRCLLIKDFAISGFRVMPQNWVDGQARARRTTAAVWQGFRSPDPESRTAIWDLHSRISWERSLPARYRLIQTCFLTEFG